MAEIYDLAVTAYNLMGWSYSDIPDLIDKCGLASAFIHERFADAESAKAQRVATLAHQLAESVERLHDVHEKTGLVPASVTRPLDDLRELLSQYVSVSSHFHDKPPKEARKAANAAVRELEYKSFGEYLDSVADEFLRCVRLLRLTVSLCGYIKSQKDRSLNKLIGDERALQDFTETFGEGASVTRFRETVDWMDKYFSRFGANSEEFSGSCGSTTFFSWFRSEGAWAHCETCVAALHAKLCEETAGTGVHDDDEVKLHLVARFCGDNLLLAIRDHIIETHYTRSGDADSSFQIIPPTLHIPAEELQTEAKADPSYRLLFVGATDHLAELHHSVCRAVVGLVDNVDSVRDTAGFYRWLDAHKATLKTRSEKVMVITSCEQIHTDRRRSSTGGEEEEGRGESDERAAGSSAAASSSGSFLAEEIVRALEIEELYHVGVAVLTCAFLAHGAERMSELRRMLKFSPFTVNCVSTDQRRLALLIEETMRPRVEPAAAAAAASPTAGGAPAENRFVTEQVSQDKAARFKNLKKKKN